jgi:hypothetical protein
MKEYYTEQPEINSNEKYKQAKFSIYSKLSCIFNLIFSGSITIGYLSWLFGYDFQTYPLPLYSFLLPFTWLLPLLLHFLSVFVWNSRKIRKKDHRKRLNLFHKLVEKEVKAAEPYNKTLSESFQNKNWPKPQ